MAEIIVDKSTKCGVETLSIRVESQRGHKFLNEYLPYVADKDPIVNVYFRIDSAYRGTGGTCGEWTREEREAFHAELADIFDSEGFSMERPTSAGSCPSGARGQEYAYCHPDDISGYFRQSQIRQIAQRLVNAKTIREMRWIDTYESFLNFTAEEIHTACAANVGALTDKLLDYFTITRRNRYLAVSPELIRACIPLRGGSLVGVTPSEQREVYRIASHYVESKVTQMVKGKLLTERADASGRPIYRAKKTASPAPSSAEAANVGVVGLF